MAPSVGGPRLSKFTDPLSVEADKIGDIGLLEDCEAGTGHGGCDESLEKTGGEANLMNSAIDLPLQDIDKLVRGLENAVSLTQSDVLSLAPGELLQGSNEALERALRAGPREWALIDINTGVPATLRTTITYTSGIVHMLHHHRQLFIGDEASKSLVLGDSLPRNGGDVPNPLDGACLWK